MYCESQVVTLPSVDYTHPYLTVLQINILFILLYNIGSISSENQLLLVLLRVLNALVIVPKHSQYTAVCTAYSENEGVMYGIFPRTHPACPLLWHRVLTVLGSLIAWFPVFRHCSHDYSSELRCANTCSVALPPPVRFNSPSTPCLRNVGRVTVNFLLFLL